MTVKPISPKSTIAKPMAGKPSLAVVKKPRAAVPKATKPTAAASAPQVKAVSAPDISPPSVNALKKKDLIDKVVKTTGAKKALVRDVIEATLSVIGDALSKGAMLNLPPFGKAKVSRGSDAASGKPMTVKLRRSATGGQRDQKDATSQPLADDQD